MGYGDEWMSELCYYRERIALAQMKAALPLFLPVGKFEQDPLLRCELLERELRKEFSGFLTPSAWHNCDTQEIRVKMGALWWQGNQDLSVGVSQAAKLLRCIWQTPPDARDKLLSILGGYVYTMERSG